MTWNKTCTRNCSGTNPDGMSPAELTVRLRLIAVVDIRITEDCIRALAAGGLTAVQLREKHQSGMAVIRKAQDLAGLCRELGLMLIINDHADWLEQVQADGVHLGQSDGFDRAREQLPPKAVLGVSVLNPAQARMALAAGADYLGVGPIFPTPSKPDAAGAIGFVGLTAVRQAEPRTPLVAIGGITAANAGQVLDAGADGLAMISALTLAADPHAAAAEFNRILAGRRKTDA